MMVRTLCRRGSRITGLWQGPSHQVLAPTTRHQATLSQSAIGTSRNGPLIRRGKQLMHRSEPLKQSGFQNFGGCSNSASPYSHSFHVSAKVYTCGSFPQISKTGSHMGLPWGVTDIDGVKRANEASNFLGYSRVAGIPRSARGVLSNAALALGEASVAGDPEQEKAGGSSETPSVSNLSDSNNGVVTKGDDSIKEEAVPFHINASPPLESTATGIDRRKFENRQQKPLDSLTRRILTGAINLKAVVSHTSPLAKTHESKKALAEQRSKKQKDASLEPPDGGSSNLESVTTLDDVVANLEALERGCLSDFRIVNEDAVKQHMSTLRDSEQKQRIGTYRTLAGRILSETSTPSSPPITPSTARGRSNSPSPKTSPAQCPDCWIPLENCMCEKVHKLSRPLWPGMRIWMLMHAKEFRRKNNTGKVMWQLFGEESARPSISGLDVLEDDMWREFAAAGPGRVFLMYPERKVQESMEIFYVDTLPLPTTSLSREAANGSCRGLETLNPSSDNAAAAADAPSDSPSINRAETSSTVDSSNPSGRSSSSPETVQSPPYPETPRERDHAAAAAPEPLHFVFLDGTWNNSTAMLVRLQQQAESVWGRKMACLCLTPDEVSRMHSLRPQPALEKVCTAAAASELLRELGARPELSDTGLSDAADTVDLALEILVTCLQGWRARAGRSPTRGPSPTPAENWVPREPGSRSRSPVRVGGPVE